MKSAATDGRFLILAIMDDRRSQTESAATDGRFLIPAIMDDRRSQTESAAMDSRFLPSRSGTIVEAKLKVPLWMAAF